MRPQAVTNLLNSVGGQTKLPEEIIIVDGSLNNETGKLLSEIGFSRLNFRYYLVDNENRGLTKQRNFGVSKVSKGIDIISFLDDDIVLEPNYFEEIEKSFLSFKDAIGVGGLDLQENRYVKKKPGKSYSRFNYYEIDGWIQKETLRFKARKILGLLTNLQPEIIPDFSHGRSGLPPNGKVYEVEHFMGGIASYRAELFTKLKFSNYFIGYGLYEDFDFCVRAMPYGKLYVNTNAQVWHYHEPNGRPNNFKYGKMVIRNGWYVWRLRFPNPSLKSKAKWHATALILTIIKLLNVFTVPNRLESLQEFIGRLMGWFSLIFNKPKVDF
jgi:GT2 family glycosyltransferase